MEIFLFEYVTSGGKVPDEIVVEGLGMFKSLLQNFNRIGEVRVNSFVRAEFLDLFPNLSVADEGIDQMVEEFAENSDCFLLIAPEDENTLLNLTKIAESWSENLGSRSEAIAVASDKWKTYKRLKGRVNVPKTSKKALDPPFLWKPRISCGGEGIRLAESKVHRKDYIAQEFIPGRNLSVSLMVGEEINLLSVNGQLIDDFRYRGAEVPARIDKRDVNVILEEAAKAVSCIRGLHGYVGVDIILASEPYVIEINARLTTPSILFDRVYGLNLPALILKNHFGSGVDWEGVCRLFESRMRVGKPLILKKTCKGERPVESEIIAEYGDWILACTKS
jgi:hypothetical protein